MAVWLIIVAMGAVTYASRLSFVSVLGELGLPAAVRRAVSLAPPAVLAALILPQLLDAGHATAFTFDPAKVLAGVLAAFVAWRTHNVLLTIGVGMLALGLLRLATS
jgi:branched-subunit amino acid transport protein